MPMINPRVRSACVDGAIKSAYAKLAQAHFNEALKEVQLSYTSASMATTRRMETVEEYLERAGAVATKWGFRP